MFQVKEERNNICRLEFLISQPALIHSLAKVIKGAMIYDNDRIIRFKAARIERLGITPLRIENAQSASSSSLITAPEGGVLNERRCITS